MAPTRQSPRSNGNSRGEGERSTPYQVSTVPPLNIDAIMERVAKFADVEHQVVSVENLFLIMTRAADKIIECRNCSANLKPFRKYVLELTYPEIKLIENLADREARNLRRLLRMPTPLHLPEPDRTVREHESYLPSDGESESDNNASTSNAHDCIEGRHNLRPFSSRATLRIPDNELIPAPSVPSAGNGNGPFSPANWSARDTWVQGPYKMNEIFLLTMLNNLSW